MVLNCSSRVVNRLCRMMRHGVMQDWSFQMGRCFVVHGSSAMVYNRCLMMQRGHSRMMHNGSFMVHSCCLMVNGSIVMLLCRRQVMGRRDRCLVVHWRFLVESLVMAFMVLQSRLVVRRVRHRGMLCMVLLGWLLGGLVMRLDGLVRHGWNGHVVALDLVVHRLMLLMRNYMRRLVVMHDSSVL